MRLISATACLVVAAVVACGQHSDEPPPLGGHPGGPQNPVGGEPDATFIVDAGHGALAVTDGGVCSTLMPTTLITQQQIPQATPQPMGGAIVPGTYALTAMNKYTDAGGATGPTTKVAAEMYAFDATSYAHAKGGPDGDGGVGFVFVDSGDYSLMTTTYTQVTTCGVGNVPLSYSAGPAEIRFSFLNEEYVLTKQ